MKLLVAIFLVLCQCALAQQSPHGAITLACETCHATDSWAMRKDATFDHATTGFTLAGRHQVVECAACHENLVFTKKSSDCTSCHTDVHQSELGTNCLRCHTNDSWIITNMRDKHQQTRFPLLGKHILVECASCHERASSHRYAGTPLTCISCHRDQYQSATNPNHVASNFSVDCNGCHKVTAMQWSGGFDHNTTGFPLTGAHSTVICASCHPNNQFTKRSAECFDCHNNDFTGTTQPNHVTGNFSHDCKSCHSTTTWKPATFDHAATHFPLTGAHTSIQCQSCHTNGNYQLTYTDCYQCHSTNFQQTTNPNHMAGNFGHNCTTCHTTTAWSPATFNHSTTNFPLTGAHTAIQCQSCHTNGNYQLTYTNCYQCHSTNFQQTTDPNHVAGNFSHDCLTCHTTTSWNTSTFDHTTTSFPLTGAHTSINCQTCHVNGNYQLAFNADCYQCHQTKYQLPTNPDHVAGNFSHDCRSCHTISTWIPSTFSHPSTPFALTGAHTTIQCQACHTSGNYQLGYSDCYQCHSTLFQQQMNPNHVTGNFSHNCQTCHSTISWSTSTFDHTTTSFPLTGAHTSINCQTCHVNGNFQLAFTDCYQCHQSNYQIPTNPNHVTANLSHDCRTCHTTTSWIPSTFSHASTNFPLTGAHTSIQCQACHTNGNYQLTYANCYQCHATTFQQTTNPNHVTRNFSHDCQACHTTASWSTTTFDHTTTSFPLTGAHTAILCQTCHTNGNYQLTFTDCYQCHQSNYQIPTNPNHVTANLSHDCRTCHTTSAWIPSTFSHTSTNFPLTGAHTSIQCQSCHANGNYQLTYTDCYQCHSTNFQQTTNPNHVTGNFSHTCTTCHTTTAWSPATFNHSTTNFPLTGTHTTITCASCHTNGNYQLAFNADCYQCHQDKYQLPTNPDHVAGSFSHDCRPCHTTSTWTPSTFSHPSTPFALTGAHTTIQCQACHTSGNYQLGYTDCYQCHSTLFQQQTNPNHVTRNFSHDCQTCHTTSAWSPATFDHTTTNFPLTGTHTTITCVSCHTNGNYQITYSGCYTCHSTEYTNTTNPIHTAAGFPTTCQTCHTTTTWAGATFNHTWFPQLHHNDGTCANCHKNPSDFSVFQCTDCHTKTITDGHHTGVSGYVYNNTNCYQCHPNGRTP
jgi:hypothetical protein